MNKTIPMKFSEDIPEEIAGAGKELPFRVPRGYFDDFPARLQAAIEQETAPVATRKLRLIDYLRPVASLAAAFAAVFLIVYWPAKLITNEEAFTSHALPAESEKIINLIEHVDDHTFLSLLENDSPAETLDDETLESYLAANYSAFDIYMEINDK